MTTSKSMSSFDDRIGRNLVDAGFITDDQLESARETGQETGVGLIETLVLDGLAHGAPIEAPERVADAIFDFAARLQAQRSFTTWK